MPLQQHVCKTLGPTGALIYIELRRCLSLRGGQIINGRKWIWKTVDDLAELFGISERTVRRHLKRIIDLGFLIRKKQKASQDWDQTYWYAWGDTDPFTEAKTCPLQGGHADRIQKVKPAGSSNGQERTNRIEGQAIPTADETATLLERIRQWPKATPPSETQKTQIVAQSDLIWDPSDHASKQQHQATPVASEGIGIGRRYSARYAIDQQTRGIDQGLTSLRQAENEATQRGETGQQIIFISQR